MALNDFLSNGQLPTGSTYTSKTSQTVLPDWYTNYAMQVLANQQAASAVPYSTYQGPRVAEFSPTQQQAFGMTGQAAGAYQPALGAATQATQGALAAPGALATAQPYFGQATALNPSAVAAGDYGSARNLAAQASGVDVTQAASPYLQQAASMSGIGAAQPTLQQALGTISQGTAASGLNTAAPYLQQAAQTVPGVVGQYMNPYTENVVNRIGELGVRNLQENIMPGIEGRYIAAGQLGYGGRQPGSGTPSGMMTDVARAVRDTSADVLAKQSEALRSGYGEAQAAAQADLARQAQLAGTAGQLGTQQQQALLEAAGQQAAVGSQFGSLTAQQQKALADIGAQFGSLAGQQQQGALSAAQQFAGLGTAASGLTQKQQELLASLGQTAGGLAYQQTGQQLAGAEQLAGLGARAQQLGLTGAGALQQVGATQQGQAQKNLDLAYADFLRQQGYPQEQINNMLQTLGGIKGAVPAATMEEGIVPLGYQPKSEPGTAATIGGALTGLAGLLKEFKVI